MPKLGEFDRLIMPLPESAQEYLGLAFEHAKDNGVIHYYRFVEDGNSEEIIDEIEEASSLTGRSYELLGTTVCGERGPSIERICFDIEVGE